ncbi:hypothetical protein ACFX1R_028127 [Malus domestica]
MLAGGDEGRLFHSLITEVQNYNSAFRGWILFMVQLLLHEATRQKNDIAGDTKMSQQVSSQITAKETKHVAMSELRDHEITDTSTFLLCWIVIYS